MGDVCHICGLCPGKIYPNLSFVLPVPICSCCLKPSGCANYRHAGRPSHLPAFSVEFEVAGESREESLRALTLLPLGYLRTHDGTVDDEYKSPIYHSLDAFRSHLPVLDTLRDLVTDACGTHLHVGFQRPLRWRLRSIFAEVFEPLADHLVWNADETDWFWGRTTCYYASRNLDADYPCIRLSPWYDTLEFRLPCYSSAAQYLEVVRFCRRLTCYLRCSLAASTNEGSMTRSPEQLGEDALKLYQATIERLSAWRKRKAARQCSPSFFASRTSESPLLSIP